MKSTFFMVAVFFVLVVLRVVRCRCLEVGRTANSLAALVSRDKVALANPIEFGAMTPKESLEAIYNSIDRA